MEMGRFFGDETMRARRLAGLPASLPCPSDFEAVFLEIGRLACEEHYRVGRETVNRWLDERGAQRLIADRAAIVSQRVEARRIGRREIVRHVVPIRDKRRVSPLVVQRAVRFLREVRNGGWIVSPTGNGDWWVGSRRRSAAELVDLAKAKGFVPSLTVDR